MVEDWRVVSPRLKLHDVVCLIRHRAVERRQRGQLVRDVLLEIRKAQLQREVFVSYGGGPRSELDGSSVPWEGIPELGVAARDTPCRYQIDAGPDSWSAVAVCDQDEDGVPAMYVASHTQPPYALTPPEVR